MAKYLDDSDLLYEIILSKGKGDLSKKAVNYFRLIGENAIRKFEGYYKNEDDKMDCLQSGFLHMLIGWKNFNEEKYSLALPYYTEIFKRGIADGHNLIKNKKSYQEGYWKMVSLDNNSSGCGTYSI